MKQYHRSSIAVAAALALMASTSALADGEAAPAAVPAAAPAEAPAAAPAAAPATPKGPTLSDILGNSGIDVKGYVDVSYIGHNRTPNPNVQVFDIDKNSFALHQAGITISSTPKEGFGGLLNLTAGRDAGIYCSYGACSSSGNTAGSGGNFDVTQGYIQYATGSWTVMAGKFVALSGVEVIDPTANTNITRNILTGKVPYTLTGLRAVNAISDTTSLTIGINNGWDQVTGMTSSKTGELGLSTSLTKDTTLAAVIYSGAASMAQTSANGLSGAAALGSLTPTANGLSGNRTQEDLILTSNLTPAVTFIINFDHVSQEKVFNVNGSAEYWDVTAYLNYQINEKYRTSFRVEKFNDESGASTVTTNSVAGSNYVNVATATVGYAPVKNFELRGEISGSQAKVGTFAASDGVLNKTLATVAIEGILKF
jgi:hypothetical protein